MGNLFYWAAVSLGIHLAIFNLWSDREVELPVVSHVHSVAYLTVQPDRVMKSRTGSGRLSSAPSSERNKGSASPKTPSAMEPLKQEPKQETAQDDIEKQTTPNPEDSESQRGEGAAERAGFSADKRDWELALEPLLAQNPAPTYPKIALRSGWEGEVLLRVRVDGAGKVTSVRVEESSGHASLDEAAVRAVSGWQFFEARQGEEGDFEVRVPIRFEIQHL